VVKRILATVLILAMLGAIGCSSMSRTQKGAVTGAAVGGAIGAAIGHQTGNTAVGAILGAAIGGAAGAWIGHYMDEQAKEIERDIEGARVERIGEGIKITFQSGLLFDVNKAELKQASKDNLVELATILNKYPDTDILLEGHTDASGSEEWNLELSEKRAKSVQAYLSGQKVDPRRFTVVGYGEQQPIASNETADSRTQNRRVEVAIFANDKLKKVAKDKTDEG